MKSIDEAERISLLTHPIAKKILESCQERAISLVKISSKKDIPLSTCYKMAYRLEEMDLLKMKKAREGSKERFLYQALPDIECPETTSRREISRKKYHDQEMDTCFEEVKETQKIKTKTR